MNIIIPKISEKTIELPTKKTIAKGVIAILLSNSGIGSATPLSLAFASTINSPYIALLSLTIGTILGKTFSLKYICGYFLFRLLMYLRKSDDRNIKAVALGFSLMFTGAVELLFSGGSIINCIYLIIESFVTGLFYLLFLKSEERSGTGAISLLIIASAIFAGFTDIRIPKIPINIGIFCSLFSTICMCYSYNLTTAVFSGSIMGLLVNINSGNVVEMMGLYALSSAMGSILSPMGKTGVCAGFLSGFTVCILEIGNFGAISIYDVIASAGLFALLPESVHYRIYDTLNKIMTFENPGEVSNKKIALQLRNIASAVRNLADGITSYPEKNEKKSALPIVFDSVAARVCKGCSLENTCWKKNSKKTYSNMYELWDVIDNDGYCDHSNIPLSFRQVCMRCESFLGEFSHAYEMYKQNCLHQGEAITERDIVARQYGEISDAISILSTRVELGKDNDDEAIPLKFRPVITSLQEPKKGQAVCGDSLIHFEKNGKYFVILCDGMGYGENALSQSRLTAKLFSEFLKAGFQKETAVNMINSTLALKADKDSFSTVDLLEIDLATGVCGFLKIGSAQSFLKTKAGIEEISSKASPVGILETIQVETQERELKNNDVILMVSDGIGEAGDGIMKNEWIKKMFSLPNRSDNDILHIISEGAKSRSRISDDMTGIIIRIKKMKGDAL